MPRITWVDATRGIAIVLMVIFHFCYDLRYFGWVDWNVPNGPNWWPFRYVILTLFVFTTGMSLSLAHRKNIRWKKYTFRLLQMIVASVAITVMSLFMFPDAWVYFGILQFLTFASVVGILFLRVPLLAIFMGSLILLGYWSGQVGSNWPFAYFDWVPDRTEDYVPVFPWLGVALLGIAFAAFAPLGKIDRWFSFLPNPILFSLKCIGRHGLVIYLLHQPILFGGLYLVSLLI